MTVVVLFAAVCAHIYSFDETLRLLFTQKETVDHTSDCHYYNIIAHVVMFFCNSFAYFLIITGIRGVNAAETFNDYF